MFKMDLYEYTNWQIGICHSTVSYVNFRATYTSKTSSSKIVSIIEIGNENNQYSSCDFDKRYQVYLNFGLEDSIHDFSTISDLHCFLNDVLGDI